MKKKETQEEVNRRIDKSIENCEKGIGLISFTGEEYKALVARLMLLHQPVEKDWLTEKEDVAWKDL